MLDLFTIFSKGGIVLWYFQGTSESFTSSVNALIKGVILQERGGSNAFTHETLTLKYKLDNEFELVFVVAYQKILQLSYIDKFLSDIQMEFRNKYKDDLQQGKITRDFTDFEPDFKRILKETETNFKQQAKLPKQMKTFEESVKAQKTVGSMIIDNKKDEPPAKGGKKKGKAAKEAAKQQQQEKQKAQETAKNKQNGTANQSANPPESRAGAETSNGELDEQTIMANRARKFGRKKPKLAAVVSEEKSPEAPKKRVKHATKWELGGTSRDMRNLDFSGEQGDSGAINGNNDEPSELEQACVGQMKGGLRDLDEEEEEPEDLTQFEEEQPTKQQQKKSGGGFGFLSGLRSLVGSKTLVRADIEPVLAKMKDHLIGKNVASDIAEKLCDSVASKLEGKVLGTFTTVTSTVRNTLQEACVQILAPKRRIDILRDAMDARQARRPYVITFCGVNGVGKSTNLAKICFWLIENGLRVLIAACDTFRAGAVEQLRTHMRKLNTLHPAEAHNGVTMVQLYEKGYGKDAAGIAMEAINHARDMRLDVVLVDTAGRMQDNEPLMRALAKLIKVNQPDLVLFVGEALVGNDAIDQLTKFNQSIADHSNMENPRLIDGIVLTKFDTIDDKVGAAISMTYTTGQPIVFVGTGQTYTDLRNLNSKAVVNALLK